MMLLASLGRRRCQPEIMDQPGLDPAAHVRALRGLARIKWFSASDRILWRPIAALAGRTPGRPLRVLDVATGGGDVPIRLWRRARRAGIALAVSGADVSETALAHARASAARAGADVTFFRLDIVNNDPPDGFDVMTSSLFLHHLPEEQALAVLGKLARAAGSLVLVNDLVRSRRGYALAWLGTRLLSASRIVHADGPRSVEAAFTLAEAKALAEAAGMAGSRVARRWPCRFLLEWSRPNA
jgi:2-polyprenyl-3-methyl-5-hydroxy-6-metoxy-1,4-benzoquinol methylase